MRFTQLALTLWLAGAVADGSEPPRNVAVHVDIETTDRLLLVPLAKHAAGKMFADIGIHLEWEVSRRTEDSAQTPILIEVVSEAPQTLRPGVLGYADLHTGNHITVFLDRIAHTQYPAIVLAHVIVHEITHLLQRLNRHSETGIMQARWSGRDYCEMRRGPLPFAPEDVALIYQGLSNRKSVTASLGVTQ